jgi:hypothetical protein
LSPETVAANRETYPVTSPSFQIARTQRYDSSWEVLDRVSGSWESSMDLAEVEAVPPVVPVIVEEHVAPTEDSAVPSQELAAPSQELAVPAAPPAPDPAVASFADWLMRVACSRSARRGERALYVQAFASSQFDRTVPPVLMHAKLSRPEARAALSARLMDGFVGVVGFCYPADEEHLTLYVEAFDARHGPDGFTLTVRGVVARGELKGGRFRRYKLRWREAFDIAEPLIVDPPERVGSGLVDQTTRDSPKSMQPTRQFIGDRSDIIEFG